MKATAQLTEEHKAVKLMLQILEEISKRLKAKEKIDPLDLNQLIEFIKVFVDGCHHTKEEKLLFPALEKAGVPKEGGPIEMMLLEHAEERVYVKDLIEGIKKYEQGDEKAPTLIVRNIGNINNLLLPHIDKEDNILYKIADMHLTKPDQRKLLMEFEVVENNKVGPGKHEEFREMIDRLKAIYL